MQNGNDQADQHPDGPMSGNGAARPAWPAVMTKSAYARYRREIFGAGCPSLITKYVAQSKISAPALRADGRINRVMADAQLAAVLDPSRHFNQAPPLQELPADENDAPAEILIGGHKSAYSAAQTALAHARRRKVEIEAAELEGRLIDKAAAERETFDSARRLRDRLLTLPHKIAGRLVGRSEPELIALLRDALTEILNEVADELDPGAERQEQERS